jgi:drug/metabolite transporter (DMT)-like permease
MRAVVFAVLAGLCWGIGEIFTKAALNSKQIGPMGVLLVRALVTLPPALVAYFAAAYLTRSETSTWWRDMDGSIWLKLVIGSG